MEVPDNVQVVGQLSYFRGNMHIRLLSQAPPTLITITAQFHPLDGDWPAWVKAE